MDCKFVLVLLCLMLKVVLAQKIKKQFLRQIKFFVSLDLCLDVRIHEHGYSLFQIGRQMATQFLWSTKVFSKWGQFVQYEYVFWGANGYFKSVGHVFVLQKIVQPAALLFREDNTLVFNAWSYISVCSQMIKLVVQKWISTNALVLFHCEHYDVHENKISTF